MPYFIFIVNSPCCPSKISLMKENIPNQTTGVMSTPNAGGIDPLTNRSRGSVGQTMTRNGNSFALADGYQERTMRHSMANEKKFKKGPSTKERGCTQASVSERITDEDAIIDPMSLPPPPPPTTPLPKAKSIKSTGDARNGMLLLPLIANDDVEENEVEGPANAADGIARPAPCAGANAPQDGAAANIAAMAITMDIIMLRYR